MSAIETRDIVKPCEYVPDEVNVGEIAHQKRVADATGVYFNEDLRLAEEIQSIQ